MKHLVIMIMLFASINLFGQVKDFKDIPRNILGQLDSMGGDDSSLLNSSESAYFNVIFEKSRQDFDFTNKKIGFLRTGNGGIRSNKIEYFKDEKDRFKLNYALSSCELYIFNDEQKERAGGYDAAILSWSKVLVPIDDVIRRLSGKNKESKKFNQK